MSIKLYVGNLSFKTNSEKLKELFEQADTVEAEVVVEDRDTGRSRGFGFVEMISREEGEAATQQFNGKEVGGRALNVNEAKPREDRRPGGGGRGGFGGGKYDRKHRGGSSTGRLDAEGVQPPSADEVRAQLAEVDEIIERLGRDRKEIDRLKKETRSNISELQRMIAA
jgi:RNA recognition motif-containing protein